MKYLDRKRLGIEVFFAQISSVMTSLNDMDAEETVRLLCEQSRRTRYDLARRINSAIYMLTTDPSLGVKEYLNDDIKELAEYPVHGDCLNRLLPFFKWLMEIQRLNKLEMEQSRYLLGDVANHTDAPTRDFINACALGTLWFPASFLNEDGCIKMNLYEHLWGKPTLIFPAAETKFTGSLPLVGLLFWIDAERIGERYRFSFLLNVEFDDEAPEKRAMQDRNWIRFNFECDRPQLVLEEFDYARSLVDFGNCGHGFIDNWCGELMKKENVMGGASLSDKERELLPMAKILKMAYQIAETEDTQSSELLAAPHEHGLSEKVLNVLENRYQFGPFEQILKDTGHEDLCRSLDNAIEAWAGSDIYDTGSSLWEFAGILREKERADEVRTLYNRIIDEMCRCTAEFTDRSKVYGSYSEAEEKMRQIIEPNLQALGFTGSYPHYRRRRGKKGEYISVMTSNVSKRTVNGAVKYSFSISAAVKKLQKLDKTNWQAGGVPFEETSAEDCRSVHSKNTKYAELGGKYDNVDAAIHIDVFDGVSEQETLTDTAMILNRFVDVAAGSMKGKKMPRWYKKKRRESPIKPKTEVTMERSLIKFLPLGLYLAVLLAGSYMVCDRYFTVTDYIPELTMRAALGISTAIGLLATVLISAVRMIRLKRQIWRF